MKGKIYSCHNFISDQLSFFFLRKYREIILIGPIYRVSIENFCDTAWELNNKYYKWL